MSDLQGNELDRSELAVLDNRDPFTRIPNEWVRGDSSGLTLTATGLLAYIMSHADRYRFSIERVARVFGCGKHTIRKAVQELEEKGFLRRSQVRKDNRIIGQKWTLTVPKLPSENRTVDPEQPSESLPSEFQTLEEQTPKKNNSKEEQEEEPVLATLAPAEGATLFAVENDEPPERGIAKRAHEKTQGAYSFVKVLPIAKWAIHTKGADPAQVERVFADLYKSGRSFSKVIVGQVLDGYGPKQRPTAKTTREIADDTAAQVARFKAMEDAEEQQHRLQLGTGK